MNRNPTSLCLDAARVDHKGRSKNTYFPITPLVSMWFTLPGRSRPLLAWFTVLWSGSVIASAVITGSEFLNNNIMF